MVRADATIRARKRAFACCQDNRTAAYLLGIPLLADYLSEAIDAFGIECEEEE
jgi:hypothetical protein